MLPIQVIPIKAFSDNYIWLIKNHQTNDCVVIDPGQSQPVFDYLAKHKLNLAAILITHHHYDHTAGIKQLIAKFPNIPVYGPKSEAINGVNIKLTQENIVNINQLNLTFKVLELPGHTLGHIGYYNQEPDLQMLFCGDTLFSAGCGRLFEGTYSELFGSLQKIANLNPNTKIYCAHEYTQANLKFALSLEPNNLDLIKRNNEVKKLLAKNLPTLPSILDVELLTNPFLRCNNQNFLSYISKLKSLNTDPLTVFTWLRQAKDNF